jgi:hypothetical protein
MADLDASVASPSRPLPLSQQHASQHTMAMHDAFPAPPFDPDADEPMNPALAILLLYGTLVGRHLNTSPLPTVGERPCVVLIWGAAGHASTCMHARMGPTALVCMRRSNTRSAPQCMQFMMIGAQTALFWWKRRHQKSYDLVRSSPSSSPFLSSSWVAHRPTKQNCAPPHAKPHALS